VWETVVVEGVSNLARVLKHFGALLAPCLDALQSDHVDFFSPSNTRFLRVDIPKHEDGSPDLISMELPEDFPHSSRRDDVLGYLRTKKVVLAPAPSGSGKVRLLPGWLRDRLTT
jgi:hypothetical protein